MTTEEPITEPKIVAMQIKEADTSQPPVMQAVQAKDIRNPWICQKCGAIMGSVFHEKIRQGLSISRLILFRGAAFIHETLPVNYIFGKVDAGEFGCSRCGEVRKFMPSPETVRYWGEGHQHVKKVNRNL